MLGQVVLGSDEVSIKTPSSEFHVPKKNIPELGYLSWIFSIPGLDKDGREFLVEFSAEEVAAKIPDYVKENGGIEQKLTVRISVLSLAELTRARTEHSYSKLWSAIDGYQDREIIRDDELGLYKAYGSKGYRGSWELLSVFPDSSKPTPKDKDSFWVASCFSAGKLGDDNKFALCSSQFLVNDLVVDYSIIDKNLKNRKAIVQFLHEKILAWRLR